MLIYYLIFISSYGLETVCTLMNKRYQLSAGTGKLATAVFLFFNGIAVVMVSSIAILCTGGSFRFTPYSFLMAFGVVACCALHTLATFKAYEKGQIAVVTVFSKVGNIVFTCLWGIFVLHEQLTPRQWIAIAVIITSVVLVLFDRKIKLPKELLWLLVVITVLLSMTDIVSKQHQIETRFETVDVLNFTLWLGIIRMVMFSWSLIPLLKSPGSSSGCPLSMHAIGYALAGSAANIVCYMCLLVAAKVLPIALTTPLGSALSISFTAVMAWIAYRETMKPRQIFGLLLCILGICLYT